jgi:hypothetical protein
MDKILGWPQAALLLSGGIFLCALMLEVTRDGFAANQNNVRWRLPV